MTQARGNSTRRRAYSEEYTSTVQTVNKRHLHSTTNIQLHLTTSDYQRIRQDLASEFFMNKTTRIYARGLSQRHSLINTKLGSSAFIATTRNQRQRTKSTRNSRLQRRRHIKTLHPTSFLKRRTRRKHKAAGYIAPEFFEDKNLDPPTFANKARGSGATLSECNFTQKEPGHKLRGCMSRNYSEDGLIQG